MAWGIIVAGLTMFGMLVLAVASALTEDGSTSATSSLATNELEVEHQDSRKAA
jgi:hypothetical protein